MSLADREIDLIKYIPAKGYGSGKAIMEGWVWPGGLEASSLRYRSGGTGVDAIRYDLQSKKVENRI